MRRIRPPLAVVLLSVASLAPTFPAWADFVLPNTSANARRGVAGCIQRSSGSIDCSGRYGGGSSGGSGSYGGGYNAFTMGMGLMNSFMTGVQRGIEEAHRRNMAMARALNDQGVAQYNRGDYTGALASFHQGLRYSPNSPTLIDNARKAQEHVNAMRAAAERQHRAQLDQAKQRISSMLGGLARDFDQKNAELAAAGNLSFVAPEGTAFFGVGGRKPSGDEAQTADDGGGLRFFGPGESLFSRGGKDSAPVDLRDGASEQVAFKAEAPPAAASATAEASEGLKFLGPDEGLQATIVPPALPAAAPPAERETVVARESPAFAAFPPPKALDSAVPKRKPSAREKPPRPSVEDVALMNGRLAAIKAGRLKVADLPPDERTKLAEMVREARSLGAGRAETDTEIADTLQKSAAAALAAASQQEDDTGILGPHYAAGVNSLGAAVAGASQSALGVTEIARLPGASYAGAAFSLGQAGGGYGSKILDAELTDRVDVFGTGKDSVGILNSGVKTLEATNAAAPTAFKGVGDAMVNAERMPGYRVSGATGYAFSAAYDWMATYGKGRDALKSYRDGDTTGATLSAAATTATGIKAGLETAVAAGNAGIAGRIGQVGGAANLFSGTQATIGGTAGVFEAGSNFLAARRNARILSKAALDLEEQSDFFRQRAKLAKAAQGPAGAKILKELEAAR